MVSVLQRSRSTRPRTSSGSSFSGLPWSTTVPPWWSAPKPSHCAAPCISGGVVITRMKPPLEVAFSASSSTVAGPGMPGGPPVIAPWKMSSWRQSTPFGAPVVPPV